MSLDLNQLDHIDDLVKQIYFDAERHFGVEFTITSLFRPEDTGVHGYGRGIDFSCPNKEFGELIEYYINKKYMYDDSRPHMKCAIFHNTGSGFHIHLQTHPDTKLIG